MNDEFVATVRTIEQARDFILQAGICGILGASTDLPTLWDAVDAPEKQPGEPGWGDKMGLVWSWKNELPARYPDRTFYGKRKGGGAILCSMAALRDLYRAQHRPVSALGEIPQALFRLIEQAPVNNSELRHLAGMAGKPHKTAFDRAMTELQVTLNIVRINRTDTDGDTWTTFAEQYPGLAAEWSAP